MEERRIDKRKPIYIGENINCYVSIGKSKWRSFIVDLNPHGVGLVLGLKGAPFNLEEGRELELNFRKRDQSFVTTGYLRTCMDITRHGAPHQRLGIAFKAKFYEEEHLFRSAISLPLIEVGEGVQPQAYCEDPFFFKERIIFKVIGFSKNDILVQASSRVKSIIPAQNLILQLYIPGCTKLFEIRGVVQKDFYLSKEENFLQLLLNYEYISKECEESITDYLIMFGGQSKPSELQDIGFVTSRLRNCIAVETCSVKSSSKVPDNFESTVLAPRVGSVNNGEFERYSRRFKVFAGQHQIAVYDIVFPNSHKDSVLAKLNYDFYKKNPLKSFIEVYNFHSTSKLSLSDFFIPVIQNIVRTAVQAKVGHVILECSSQVFRVLKAIGFKKFKGSREETNSKTGEKITYMAIGLTVNDILTNKQGMISTDSWNTVYDELNRFLDRGSPDKSAFDGGWEKIGVEHIKKE